MKEKHYKMTQKDFGDLLAGKEIFFYQGTGMDMYIQLSTEALALIAPKKEGGSDDS